MKYIFIRILLNYITIGSYNREGHTDGKYRDKVTNQTANTTIVCKGVESQRVVHFPKQETALKAHCFQ